MAVKRLGNNLYYDDTNDRIGNLIGNLIGGAVSAGVARESDGMYKGVDVGVNNGYLKDADAYNAKIGGVGATDNTSTPMFNPNYVSDTNNAIGLAQDEAMNNNKFEYYSKLTGNATEDAISNAVNSSKVNNEFDFKKFTSPFLTKLKENMTNNISYGNGAGADDLKNKILKNSYGSNSFSNPFLKGW